jgi:hypothetical protein
MVATQTHLFVVAWCSISMSSVQKMCDSDVIVATPKFPSFATFILTCYFAHHDARHLGGGYRFTRAGWIARHCDRGRAPLAKRRTQNAAEQIVQSVSSPDCAAQEWLERCAHYLLSDCVFML